MASDSRPTNPGTHANKLVFYKAEKVSQFIVNKHKIFSCL